MQVARRQRRRWIGLAVGMTVLSSTACGEREPPEPLTFEHAYAQRTCAPWDGPATAVYLSDGEAAGGVVPRPMLMISVYESMIQASGKRYRITPEDDRVGVALECPIANGCVPFPEARVEFGSLQEDAPAPVTVRLTREDGRAAEGQFRATWLQPADICG